MERQPTEVEERKTLAEIEVANVTAKKLAAETTYSLLESRAQIAYAEKAEIEVGQSRHAERVRRSQDIFHHVYTFDSVVSSRSVAECVQVLRYWQRTDEPSEIEFVIDSPGGSVFDGMFLFDYIQTMRRQGWKFKTVSYGMAASMGGILLQAGDVRAMSSESYILIHEISTVMGGKIGEIEDEMALLAKMQDRVLDIFVLRANGKITRAQFKAKWKRRDWWLDSTEALKLGIVDEVC